MSHLEMRSIEAFSQLELLEQELRSEDDLVTAGRIFMARMDICAYVNELKMQRVLTNKDDNKFEEEVCLAGWALGGNAVEYSLRTTKDTFTLVKYPGSFQRKELVVFNGSTMERSKADIERLKENMERFLTNEVKP